MYRLDSFELVRRSVIVAGMSKRAAAREYGVNRRVVDKMVVNASPPGYQLSGPRKRRVLGAYMQQIEEILLKDRDAPSKQRHTGQHIFERLRDEFGYTGNFKNSSQQRQTLNPITRSCPVPPQHQAAMRRV